TYEYARYVDLNTIGKEILLTRLDIAKLTPEVVHAEMLYSGGQAYIQGNDTFRRLRESYFLLNLSPTIMLLETLC
ncbi:acyl-CoA dehydrogenase, partial [Bacillus sp. sid0103]|nr:acyl-CoA dehydrogenase [Bacillus sp. sid0103]